jgi:hypothetical protein
MYLLSNCCRLKHKRTSLLQQRSQSVWPRQNSRSSNRIQFQRYEEQMVQTFDSIQTWSSYRSQTAIFMSEDYERMIKFVMWYLLSWLLINKTWMYVEFLPVCIVVARTKNTNLSFAIPYYWVVKNYLYIRKFSRESFMATLPSVGMKHE